MATGGRGGGTGGAAGVGAGGSAETYPIPNPIPPDEDGSLLWLRYKKVPLPGRLAEYQAALNHVVKAGGSATLQAAQSELLTGLGGLLGVTVPVADQPTGSGAVVLGTPASSTIVANLALVSRLPPVGQEGYLIEAADVGGKAAIVVAANTDVGVLLITHSPRILRYIKPDFVHVFVDGKVVEEGGPELADRLEAEGYDRYVAAAKA